MVPQPQTAAECIEVVPEAGALRQALQARGIATADNDILHFEHTAELLHNFLDGFAPALVTQALTAPLTDIFLESAPVPVRHVPDLHGLDQPIHDESGAKAGTQAEEQHPAALVAADGLHGCIVDHPDGHTEGLLEIELHPPLAEIVRLGGDTAMKHQARIAYRHNIERPARHDRGHLPG